MSFVEVTVFSLLVSDWGNVSVVGPGTVVVGCVSVKAEIPSVSPATRHSFLFLSETQVTLLSFGHSVDLFLWQARAATPLVPALTGYIARLPDLCSEIWFLLKVCTCPGLSEGAKEAGWNSRWECTFLFHGLCFLWKEAKSFQVSGLSPCLVVSYHHCPFFSGAQEESSVFAWKGTPSCLHRSLHPFLGSPSLGVQ